MSELKAYKMVNELYCTDRPSVIPAEVYFKSEADKVIAEKDAEIAKLKDKCQMHDFFWEGCGFDKLGFKNSIAVREAFDRLEAENAELKQKLEDVQASAYAESAYAESVDAGMRERRLRRALWLKRADDAKHLVVAYENYDYLDCQEMTIKQESARTWMTCKLRTAEEWVKVWKNVERKCREKAEEYK